MNAPRIPYAWRIAEQDRTRARALGEAVDIPPLLAHLLLLRGVGNEEEARRFLFPSMKHLSDPFLLTDMRPAVERIREARERDEHVHIFGDYDVDGVSATVLLLDAFKRFGLRRISYGMPQRLTEGYGLQTEHVEEAQRDGVTLLVTVDNGISAHKAAARARELGVDLIITDHHRIEGTVPDAVAVVNPKREDPSYPGFHLCGAGVAFKLSTALNGTLNDLDIAALGTVADIVPLLGENRVLVSLGLRHMAKYERLGLAKLAGTAHIHLREISAEKIGFQLGPRLNAAGRLDDAMTALELLLSESPEHAERLARELNAANEERRTIERHIFEEAVEELEVCLQPERCTIVLGREGWHAGVIGIVASRLQMQYGRPVALIAIDEEGAGRGSARSGPELDLIGALSLCAEHLTQFGGHQAAAGFTINARNIDAFRRTFEAEALHQLGPGAAAHELAIDAVASFGEIDSALLKALERLEPIGHHNPAPVFCSMTVDLVPQSTRVLKDRHLKMTLRQGNAEFSAIGFNMAERYYTEALPRCLDVAYTPQFNTWRDETTIQLVLKDLRPASA